MRIRLGDILWYLTVIALVIFFVVNFYLFVFAETGTETGQIGIASYFTRQSCIKEGSSTKLANGKELDDNSNVCGSWDYPLGSKLRVTNLENGKVYVVEVATRGPATELVRSGRIIDLSKKVFKYLSNSRLDKGIIKVKVERTEE